MKPLYLAIATALVAASCSQNDNPLVSTSTPATGTVKGRILDQEYSGKFRAQVVIYGTNITAFTDPDGFFTLFNVPEGTYYLSVPDSVIQIDVCPGDTLILSEIIIEDSVIAPASTDSVSVTLEFDTILFVDTLADNSPVEIDSIPIGTTTQNNAVSAPDSFSITDLIIYDASTNNILQEIADASDESIIFAESDSIYLRFLLLKNTAGGNHSPAQESVSICWNDSIIYNDEPLKGRGLTRAVARTGIDTFTIMVDSRIQARFQILDSAHIEYANTNFLLITTGRSPLVKSQSHTSSYFAVIETDTFWIKDKEYDSIDWDLYLINDSEHDTCKWSNRNPDWGTPGLGVDNPVFSGDSYELNYSCDSAQNIAYLTDQIKATDLAPGTYSIYVRFHDGPGDSLTALPTINIGAGLTSYSKQLKNLYSFSPRRPMVRGETWYAGKIIFPDKRYDPTEHRIIPSSFGMEAD
ncbi:MAG: hypothetical protein GF350_09565 [Chitinivibrionales bacterium]|nr:hypothetical protein [Chitinivibrionales bacterium]